MRLLHVVRVTKVHTTHLPVVIEGGDIDDSAYDHGESARRDVIGVEHEEWQNNTD